MVNAFLTFIDRGFNNPEQELIRIYFKGVGEHERYLTDFLIKAGKNKIAVVKYFYNSLGLSLSEAKWLYEERERFFLTVGGS